MKKLIISAIAALSIHAHAQITWSLDKAHTKLGFTVTHLMLSETEGYFKNYDVKLTSKDETFENATVEVSIDVNSINTEQEDRDAHLKKEDMFNAAKYPTITFKSKSFKKVGDKKYKVEGDLTIKGITKPVTLDVIGKNVIEHPFNKKRVTGFKFTTTFKRTDFGVGNVQAAVVGEDINITGSMEFFKD